MEQEQETTVQEALKRMDFFRVAEGLGPAKNIEIERWVYILVKRGLEGNIFTLFV